MDALNGVEARILMADLLAWPRREAKPEWWQYFERRDRYDEADLIEDSETIAGLMLDGEVGREKQSIIWRYRFDPSQECKVRIGDRLHDPISKRPEDPLFAGTVVAFDPIEGTINLRRGAANAEPHPVALFPSGPIDRMHHQAALAETANALLEHATDGAGPLRTGRRLVARIRPTISADSTNGSLRRAGESTLDAAIRLVDRLDESVLPVQGPPGSGKTFTAARVILDQTAKDRKVGITGPSHAAVNKLIEEIVKAVPAGTQAPTIVKKANSSGRDAEHALPVVTYTTNKLAGHVGTADIVAGTSWAFADPGMAGALDLLLVDEAGQMSLADVVAIARSARNVALFGDPMQLAQPTKGTHPGMAGLSALEHLCAGHATIPEDAGLLLDVSWRMHPSICAFISEQVYDSRLTSREECGVQQIGDGPLLQGSGLRWVPVDHSENRTSSPEEAAAIEALCDALLGRTWTDERGDERKVSNSDILVVTPYNAQANLIRQRIGASIDVGTVDMFQGREAAVVLVSLAASTLEDIPRGIDFLLSKNRLNVAISRAKALCAIVASPALLTARCTTLEQMKLVNTLCRYAEVADTVAIG